MRRLLVLFVVTIAAFSWGAAVGAWKVFPSDVVRTVYHFIVRPPPPVAEPVVNISLREGSPPLIWGDGEIERSRIALREYLVPTKDVRIDRSSLDRGFLNGLTEPTRSAAVRASAGAEIYEVSGAFDSIHQWRWRAALVRSGGRKLLIIHRGHGSNPFDGGMVEAALKQGYDVAAFVMPMVSWNYFDNVEVKTWDGLGVISGNHPGHGALEMVDTGDHHFSGFLVSPVLAALDELSARWKYDSVSMIGLSGGGWTAVLAAAVDQRISATVSVAGTLPFFARQHPKDVGDAEQFDHALYRRFPWTKLYQMASRGGRLTLMFNKQDPCCFDGASAGVFAKHIDGAAVGYSVRINEKTEHDWSPSEVMEALER